mmetsp:Transcript_38317/g.108346  ORF Transcript_38317/g.108346 Transcript_38317/m.108346 type:complete len:376 (+) Transcript_38317:180-1307(+)|eukprot:CAMPEP_0117675272 /NCGR_PEP_ID=MMETSP0804-20121206/15512_1 /TAXON_ID=1074897 /ORGANISM="Tetraselmis astigmatica, Strain CCMP880" /LENGTH=375 /DNA_ID=CAMNT_0005484255 /DNA_START=120 /DNA_END=1247 /DNA_ORIENTATION=+
MVWGRRQNSEDQALDRPQVSARLASATLSSASKKTPQQEVVDAVPASTLLVTRPLALLHLVPRPAVLFTAGAAAGAIGKTLTAPLDRVKLLLQVQGGYSGTQVAAASKSGNLLKALVAIGREEGFLAYWKGNIPQVARVIPYAAAQLYSYEFFKGLLHTDKDTQLSVPRRLVAGACAGMFSTVLTYPLDSIRLRLAVDPSVNGMGAAARVLVKEGGVVALYRGVGTSMLGIAPYLALELAAFDMIPNDKVPSFARGFCAALLATSVCYPLDTLRRQMQMQTKANALPLLGLVRQQISTHGVQSLYRGFLPNALKNLPNKGIRLSVFDTAKQVLSASQTAYQEELEAYSYRSTSASKRMGCITVSPLGTISSSQKM